MSDVGRMLKQAVGLHQAGRLDEAAELYRRITRRQPGHADAWHLCGLIDAQHHNYPAAIESISKAVRLKPGIAEFHCNLANVYLELGRWNEAIDSARTALKLKPDSAEAFGICGNAFQALDELELALDCQRQAVRLDPSSPDHRDALAIALRGNGHLEEACVEHLRALELKPGWDLAINNYAATLLERGQLVAALQQYAQAIESLKLEIQSRQTAGKASADLTSRMARVLFNLGNAFRDYGDPDAAIQAYQQSLQFEPDFTKPRSNWIYLEQFLPGVTPQRLAELHREWDRRIVQPLVSQHQSFTNHRDPDRRLRLGILSPNFGTHPAAFLMVRGVESLPRDQFEVICYSDRSKHDSLTRRFHDRADQWKPVLGLPDATVANLIRADGIDLLIVTSGHTGNNRLLVAARKPAPVQIAWTGDPAGISSIDGLIADRFLIPDTNDRFHAEKVIRMPHGYATFDPPSDAPAVGPCPEEQNGFITFGSFNQPIKYHAPLLECWIKIMASVPESRLLLVGTGMDHARSRLVEMFGRGGIASNRLDMHDRIPRTELLAFYNRVDIGLDSFPFSGGITTLEALWMGVPVVSVPSETFAGRTSLTWLSNLDLHELTASSPDDYVERVIALTGQKASRVEYRAHLRDRIANSPICDGAGFAAALTHELRRMWQAWCAASSGEVGDRT